MGVTRQYLQFLDDVFDGVGSVDSALTLGRQNLLLSPTDISVLSRQMSGDVVKTLDDEYAERSIKAMFQCRVCDTMDASAYEGAAVIHDLNKPVPQELREQYDLVIDGGTLEHVFDVATALKNIELMLRPGGVFVSHTIANGFMGHGFYQFSPELFYRAFSRENRFCATRIFVQPLSSSTMAVARSGPFYLVADPDEIGERVLYSVGKPLSMFVVARKDVTTTSVNSDSFEVQQSDYSSLWHTGNGHPQRAKRWRAVNMARRVPVLGALAIHAADQVLLRSRRSLVNRRYYRRVSAKARRASIAGALTQTFGSTANVR